MENKQKLLTSGKDRPCPICGRTKNNACRISLDGHLVLCHDNMGSTLKEGWVYKHPDRSGRCGVFVKIADKTSRPVGITYTHTYESYSGDRYIMRRSYDKSGKKEQRWTTKLNCTEDELLPYRWNDVKDKNTIFVLEGELKCDRLIELGFPATSCRKWTAKQAKLFTGKQVIIIPDCDSTGIGKAKETGQLLKQYTQVKYCYLPNIGSWDYPPDSNGLDIYDWLDKGGNPNEIDQWLSDSEPSNPEYEKLLDQLINIFNSEDSAKKTYMLNKLAQSTKIPVVSLTAIHRNYLNDLEASAPITGIELLAEENDGYDFFIEDLIPKRTTILIAGDGGCGKTTLIYNLIRNCLKNSPCPIDLQTKQANLLIIQSDDNIVHTKRTLTHLQYQNADNWKFKDKWHSDQIHILKRWITENNCDLVIIDSLTSINRHSGQDKDTSYANVLYDLRDISTELNCTFVVIHHTNKGGAIKGTTAITYASSEIWEIRKPKEGEPLSAEHRILKISKSRSGITGEYLFEFDSEYYYKYCGKWENNEAYKPNAILDFIRNHPDEWHSAKSLAQYNLGNAKKENIARILNDLYHRRKILIRQKEASINSGRPSYRYQIHPKFKEEEF